MPDRHEFPSLRERLAAGTQSAAAAVFDRYAADLVGLAERQIAGNLRPKFDGEDVVQSALRSFFLRQQEGQFELTSWDSLWGLLVRITLRKCGRREVFWTAARRDYRRERPLEVLQSTEDASAAHPLDMRPTAHEAAVLRETLQAVLAELTDTQQTILMLDLEGHTALEISQRVNRSVRTVRRTLRIVREALAAHCDLADAPGAE
jgi:RNA polymerase sigma factor (sigma-70 family)